MLSQNKIYYMKLLGKITAVGLGSYGLAVYAGFNPKNVVLTTGGVFIGAVVGAFCFCFYLFNRFMKRLAQEVDKAFPQDGQKGGKNVGKK